MSVLDHILTSCPFVLHFLLAKSLSSWILHNKFAFKSSKAMAIPC